MRAISKRNRDIWKVDSTGCIALIRIAYKFFSHFQADIRLSFLRWTANMWCQNHIIKGTQWWFKLFICWFWLFWKNINCCTKNFFALKCCRQCINVHTAATRSVDEKRPIFHLFKCFGSHDIACTAWIGYMQGNNIRFWQQFLQTTYLCGIAQGKLGHRIMIDYFHTQTFSQYR